jgi:hypothetical protein
MAPKKQTDFCPKCYLEQSLDVPIIYTLGSTKPLKCKNEHVFEDREELSDLTRQMLERKKALAPPPEPVQDLEPLPPPDESNAIALSTNPIDTGGHKPLTISSIDMKRITDLIGSFRDSSTLFGTIYALTQELNDNKELLRRMNDAKKVANTGTNAPPTAGPRAIGGDIAIQLIIPERWVQAISDIAEANGMDITRYMNAKVEDGLDNQWYC